MPPILQTVLVFGILTSMHSLSEPPTVVEVPKPADPKWVEFKVAAGEQLQLKSEKGAKWALLSDGAQLRTPLDALESFSATFTATKAGRYLASTTTPDGTTLFAVNVTGSLPGPGPGPTPPGPGPGPTPPTPVPPTPIDPLRAKIKYAYDNDPEVVSKKQAYAKDLAALYTAAAAIAKVTTVTTSGQLLDKVREASKNLLKDPTTPGARKNLSDVRQTVAGELGVIFPADAPLTDAQRDAAAELFTKLAAILEAL